MRNKSENRIGSITFAFLGILSFVFVILPLIEQSFNIHFFKEISNSIVNVGLWFATALSGFLCVKLHKTVLKHETYCRDSYFIDRLEERHVLFSFLESKDNNTLFFVKGGMCRGKTMLLQRFADDVNHVGFKNEFQRQYHKAKQYSAYYIAINQSCSDIVQKISLDLCGDEKITTYDKLSIFLRKASYRKKVVLLIDNISKAQSHIAIETARALLYDNTRLKIILGITEETTSSNLCTLTPPLFGEMQINELARIYNKELSTQDGQEIIRISSGIPSYIRMLFQADTLKSPITLSNIENIQNVVYLQLQKLGDDNNIAAYLACLKLCQKQAIPKDKLLIMAQASEFQLSEVFDAALAREEISLTGSAVIMDAVVAECCRKILPYHEFLFKIYTFYEVTDSQNDIVLTSLLMLPESYLQSKLSEDILETAYKEKKYFLFAWLGDLDKNHELIALYNKPELYNAFRYYYLCSLLQLGEYSMAIDTLKCYEQSDILLPSLREIYSRTDFEMQFLIMDLHHLSNQFNLALGEIDVVLAGKDIHSENKHRLLYLKAHCLKHLGKQLQEADYILKELEKERVSNDLYIKILYSQIAIHLFWGDTAYDYELIIKRLNDAFTAETIPEKLHAMRHLAHYSWKQEGSVSNALNIIDEGLEILEKTRWRIIYDYYFEKAEWMRIQNTEAKRTINNASMIIDFYEKAIQFAEENRDINLACCARLGKILTQIEEHSQSTSWCKKMLKVLDKEYIKMDQAGLEIDKAYVTYIKALLSNEQPSEEFIRYCKINQYYDLSQHIEQNKPFKLTVM